MGLGRWAADLVSSLLVSRLSRTPAASQPDGPSQIQSGRIFPLMGNHRRVRRPVARGADRDQALANTRTPLLSTAQGVEPATRNVQRTRRDVFSSDGVKVETSHKVTVGYSNVCDWLGFVFFFGGRVHSKNPMKPWTSWIPRGQMRCGRA